MMAQSPDGEPIVREVLSDDPLVMRLEAEVAAANGGKGLDSILNPAKLINLEREILRLREELEGLDAANAADAAVRDEIEASIDKKARQAAVEKRSVMRGWLKGVFRGQAGLSGLISLLAVYDVVPFASPGLDLSLRVLGFWSWWLFTVPSLRSVKPLDPREKRALDAAFLLTLVVSLAAPFATKDPATIWWADALTVGGCYGTAYVLGEERIAAVLGSGDDDDGDADDGRVPSAGGAFGASLWRGVKWAGRALDVGGGQERGARTGEASALERSIADRIAAKAVEAEAAEKTADALPADEAVGAAAAGADEKPRP